MTNFPVATADTGLTLTESISVGGTRKPTDTGLSLSVAAPQRILGRFITGTGATITDTLVKRSAPTISDTGATISDSTPTAGRPSDQGMYGTFPLTPLQTYWPLANTESPLNSGGTWLPNPGTYSNILGYSFGTISASNFFLIGQQTYVGAGVLSDCEAYVTIAGLGFSTGFLLGVVLRQDPGSPAGANCYAAVYLVGSPTTTGTIEILKIGPTGNVTVLGSVPVSYTSPFGGKVGFRAVGSTLTAYYQNSTLGSKWIKVLEVHDSTYQSGYMGLRMNAGGISVNNFGGGSVTDALVAVSPRFVSDTGLTVAGDVIAFAAFPVDTGMTLADSIASRRTRRLSDTGLTVTDHPSIFGLTDTGLSLSDGGIHAQRVAPRAPTDTLTFSDTLARGNPSRRITDQGMTFSMGFAVTKNGAGGIRQITDFGLTLSTSLAKVGRYFRSMKLPTDIGASITAGVHVTRTPPFKPKKPKANFTYSGGILTAYFTDTSDPGSAPIESWEWTFGDGGTSSATNPTHIYGAAGVYNVGLTVTTIYGVSHVTKPVTVVAGPVVAGTHIDAVIV